MTGAGERFTGRWSRLKQDARAPAPADESPTAGLPAPEEAEPPAPETPAPETPAVAAEDLPDIESLDKDSDYTPFMAEGVPEELKKLALRVLWRSDPVLANLDGLNDYDEDFKAAHAIGAEFMRKLREAGEKVSGEQPDREPETDGSQNLENDEIVADNADESPDPEDGEIDGNPETG